MLSQRLPELLDRAEDADVLDWIVGLYYRDVEDELTQEVRRLHLGFTGDLYTEFIEGPDRDVVQSTGREIVAKVRQLRQQSAAPSKAELDKLREAISLLVRESRRESIEQFRKWIDHKVTIATIEKD